jgi:hypothetical protein
MESSLRTYSPLAALVLFEEQACERYRTAVKSMRSLAGEFERLRHLTAAYPSRTDYRVAANTAQARHTDAAARADLARELWQRAQYRTDAQWTATTGRVRAVPVAA